VDEQPRKVDRDRGPGRRPSMLLAVAAAIPTGTKYGALVGAGYVSLWCVFLYPFLLYFAIPIYALAGGLLGALSAAIVGAVSARARSVKAGRLVGGAAGLVLGLALLARACLAPARPPPIGPGRPINPAADVDEERKLERDHLLWMAEQDRGERGAFVIFVALPATICALTSAWSAGRRLGSRHPELDGDRVGSAPRLDR
jgi:hypothetical protein